jgi:hypothetical protein
MVWAAGSLLVRKRWKVTDRASCRKSWRADDDGRPEGGAQHPSSGPAGEMGQRREAAERDHGRGDQGREAVKADGRPTQEDLHRQGPDAPSGSPGEDGGEGDEHRRRPRQQQPAPAQPGGDGGEDQQRGPVGSAGGDGDESGEHRRVDGIDDRRTGRVTTRQGPADGGRYGQAGHDEPGQVWLLPPAAASARRGRCRRGDPDPSLVEVHGI